MKRWLVILPALLLNTSCTTQASKANSLWYEQPSHGWEQSAPLGNGRLAMAVYGTADEFIVFNEDSLWSGWPEKNNDREGSFEALQKIRKLIKERAPQKEIKAVAMNDFCSLHGYGKPDFGAYQPFFNAHIDFGHDPKAISGYRRRLDLDTAVADVAYDYQGIHFKREYFCSYPGQVGIMRFSADKIGSINLTFGLSSQHKNIRVTTRDNILLLDGKVDVQQQGKKGMRFQSQLQFRVKGGQLSQTTATNEIAAGKETISCQGPAIKITGADEVVVIVTGATNYKLSGPDYKGDAPSEKNRAVLDHLKNRSYAALKAEHIKDYQGLSGRVEFKLAGTDRSDLPTDKRRKEYRQSGHDDPALEALLFQYGRYLMIASSRPGSLPANLQGLWNNSRTPPWNCDYHLNINMQMNYWPVDLCNLSDCMEPVIDWTADVQKAGEKTARIHYNSKGWTVHHSANVWGFTSPGPNRGIHMLEAESAAFLCQNIWDHYAYTADRKYLEKKAWPIMKGAAEFWVDNLQEVEGGYLAVSPSYSPEQGPLTDGAYYQTMIIGDLFTNCIKATEILSQDRDFAETLRKMRDRLQPMKIGEYGQLQEWRDSELPEEKKSNKNKHRHVSHMYAVYPGTQIIPERDKELTRAAIQSMNYRGDGATGWSMGWKTNIWARLRDGNRAHKLINSFISSKVYDNLWCAHPPFQIDGNFGYTAGVAELLMQSHVPSTHEGCLNEIHLLPALPGKWKTGSIEGLKARGGVEMAISWEDGELENAEAKAAVSGKYTFVYKDKKVVVELKKGKRTRLNKYLID